MKNRIKNIFTLKRIIIGTLLIAIIYIYNSDSIMFRGVKKVNNMTKGVFKLELLRDKAMHSIDDLSTTLFSEEYESLPRFNIKIDNKAVQRLTEIVENGKSSDAIYPQNAIEEVDGNDYSKKTKIKFTFEDETYKAKIRIHGRGHPHFINDKRSYSIKLSKDKLFMNMREFGLIVPEEQDSGGPFGYYLAKRYLGFETQSFFVKVSFNGVDQGIYTLEEKLKKELLEKNNLSGVDKMQPSDEWTTQYKGTPHVQPYTNDISYVKLKNYSKKENGQLLRYKQLYESDTYASLTKLLDIDRFARFEALRVLTGDRHIINGDNLRLLYDNSTGRFLPYLRNEGFLNRIEESTKSKTFESTLMNKPIFKVLSQSNEFRQLRNTYLYQMYEDRSILKKEFASLKEKYIKIINSDVSNNHPQRQYLIAVNKKESNLNQNLKYINKYLSYSRVYITAVQNDSKNLLLTISPDSNVNLLVDSIKSVDIKKNAKVRIENIKTKRSTTTTFNKINNFLNEDAFILNIDDKLELEKNPQKYKLTFDKDQKMNKLEYSFKNSLTLTKVKDRNIFSNYIKKPHKFSFKDIDINKVLSTNAKINLIDNTFKFIKGEYLIDDDLILPYGYNLQVEAGTIIKIAPGKSILVQGNLDISGTSESPVSIVNLIKNKPFGVFGVVGDGKSTVDINNLKIYGGNEDYINGAFLSGELSLYNHSYVSIKNSHIHHGSADDGLNIKNAHILLENNIFNSNLADQVDLDFCTGIVKNNKFISRDLAKFDSVKINEDSNGDGLDFSGSKIIVKNNLFDGFLDKGISVGENTQAFIYKNIFSNNRSAITAKDQSNIYVYLNNYTDNKINIEMYQKKKIFKHPSLYNINETHDNSKIKKSIKSHYYKVEIDDPLNLKESLDETLIELKKLEWIEYE